VLIKKIRCYSKNKNTNGVLRRKHSAMEANDGPKHPDTDEIRSFSAGSSGKQAR